MAAHILSVGVSASAGAANGPISRINVSKRRKARMRADFMLGSGSKDDGLHNTVDRPLHSGIPARWIRHRNPEPRVTRPGIPAQIREPPSSSAVILLEVRRRGIYPPGQTRHLSLHLNPSGSQLTCPRAAEVSAVITRSCVCTSTEAAQAERNQLPKALVAEWLPADALMHVGVGAAVGFDDRRAILQDRHVPADEVAVVERRVGALGERARFGPQRQDAPFDQAAG